MDYGKWNFWLAVLNTVAEYLPFRTEDKNSFQIKMNDRDTSISRHVGEKEVNVASDDTDIRVLDNSSGSRDVKNLIDFAFKSGPKDNAVKIERIDPVTGKVTQELVPVPKNVQLTFVNKAYAIAKVWIGAFGSENNAALAFEAFNDDDLRNYVIGILQGEIDVKRLLKDIINF